MAAPLNLPDGWLTDAEARELQRWCKNKYVLEIGAYLGRSTVAIAQVARHVVSIDHHRGSPEHQPGHPFHDPALRDGYGISTLAPFLANLRRFGVADKVSVVVASSEQVDGFLAQGVFEVAFVDGQHDYESTRHDIGLALASLKKGGIVLCHDYQKWPGVREVVDVFASNRGKISGFASVDSMKGLKMHV